MTMAMFNPEKDFNRMVIETLGKEGKSISSLTKELETKGIKHHRLILTGYLRALTDVGILKEKEIPPSKIYIPIRTQSDNVYQAVSRAVKKYPDKAEDLTLYVLFRLLKRPIFESELKQAGVVRINGIPADAQSIAECKKVLRRSRNIISNEQAFGPVCEFPNEYSDIISDMFLESKDSKHLVMETKQTKLM
jgi:hypothetical protein